MSGLKTLKPGEARRLPICRLHDIDLPVLDPFIDQSGEIEGDRLIVGSRWKTAVHSIVGDPFDMEIGGFTPSGGTPVRITGTLSYVGEGLGYSYIAAVDFGAGNTVFLTPAYSQVRYPERLKMGNVDPGNYDVFVVKSRVHFRRGFDETGYARTIIVVEAPEPFVGTTALDALPYENVDLSKLYPFGAPQERP